MDEARFAAVHEAGHALAAVLLGAAVGVVKLLPDHGQTWVDETNLSVEDSAVVMMAGIAALWPFRFAPGYDERETVKLVGAAGLPVAYRRACDLLAGRGAVLGAIADALLVSERLTGDQVVAIVKTASWRTLGETDQVSDAGPDSR